MKGQMVLAQYTFSYRGGHEKRFLLFDCFDL